MSLNVVLPLFLMMALGYFLRRVKMFDDAVLLKLNNLTFKVFLPVLIYNNVYQTNIQESFNLRLVFFAACCVVGSYIVVSIVIPMLEKDNRKRGVLIQGIFRSNFVIFGLPVSIALTGQQSAGSTALMIAVIIPIFNMLSVVALEFYRGGKVNFKKMLLGIAKNPLIIACIFGFITIGLQIKFPSAITATLNDLSKIATPLALVALGGTFKFTKVTGYVKQLILGLGGKLLLVPAVCIPLSVMMGFRGSELSALMVLFASPVAVSSFVMAQQMDGDSDLAGQLVVLGSALSVFTIFLWIFVLKQMCLF